MDGYVADRRRSRAAQLSVLLLVCSMLVGLPTAGHTAEGPLSGTITGWTLHVDVYATPVDGDGNSTGSDLRATVTAGDTDSGYIFDGAGETDTLENGKTYRVAAYPGDEDRDAFGPSDWVIVQVDESGGVTVDDVDIATANFTMRPISYHGVVHLPDGGGPITQVTRVEARTGGDDFDTGTYHTHVHTKAGTGEFWLPLGFPGTYHVRAESFDHGAYCHAEATATAEATGEGETLTLTDGACSDDGGGEGAHDPSGSFSSPGTIYANGWASNGFSFASAEGAEEGSVRWLAELLHGSEYGDEDWASAQQHVSAEVVHQPDDGTDASCQVEASDGMVAAENDGWDQLAVQCFPDPWNLPDGDYRLELGVREDGPDGEWRYGDAEFTVDSTLVTASSPALDGWPVVTGPVEQVTVTLENAVVAEPEGHNPTSVTLWSPHTAEELRPSACTPTVDVATLTCEFDDPLPAGEWVVDYYSYVSDASGTGYGYDGFRPVRVNQRFWVGPDIRISVADGGPLALDDTVNVSVTDHDANADPTTAEAATVTVHVDGDQVALALDETGADTGIFTGSFDVVTERVEPDDVAATHGSRVDVTYHVAYPIGGERTWYSTALRVGAWPECSESLATDCIQDFAVDLDGGDTPEYTDPPVGLAVDAVQLDDGRIELAVTYEGRHDVVAGSPLDAGSLVRVVLNVGDFDPVTTTTTGAVTVHDVQRDGETGNTVELVVAPRHLGYARTLPADVADWSLQGGLSATFSNFGEDTAANDASRGSWIATNAQRYSSPTWDAEAAAFTFDVQAPHAIQVPDRGPIPIEGFVQAYLTNTQLELMGLEPSEVEVGSFAVTVNGEDAFLDIHGDDGGRMLHLYGFGYSTKSVRIATARPTVEAVSPATTTAGTAQAVTVTGTNFRAGATATVGITALTDVTVVDPTTITGTVPVGVAVGSHALTVANTDGSSGTKASAFTVTSRSSRAPDPRPTPTPRPTETRRHEAVAPPGGTVRIEPDGAGPTADHPVSVAITTPTGGTVQIGEAEADGTSTSGFVIVGRVYEIEAPPATVEEPLRLTFDLDDSLLTVDEPLAVFRDGVRVATCTSDTGTASPDPCLLQRETVDGDVRVTVLSSHASTWAVGVVDADSLELVCPAAPAAGFEDVSADHPHAAAIGCLATRGVVHGRSETGFDPGSLVTRGQSASMLARVLALAGVNLPGSAGRFDDLTGSPHADAVEQLAELGIMQGRSPRRAGAHLTLTRGQMATLLLAAFEEATGRTAPPSEQRFDDVPDASLHAAAIASIARLELAEGTSPDTFEPDAPLRRGQLATFLGRLLNRLAAEGAISD